MSFKLGRWAHFKGMAPFTSAKGVRSFAGISGGRTSAMMSALLDEETTLTFQNTGREHPRTLDFLDELDDRLGRRIVWLEFRKPKVKGARPRDFEFAVVDYRSADRSGGPFEAMLEALAEYRAMKGDPKISPWARSRLCTAYLKQKVCDHFVTSLGVTDCDRYVGLRYDEPERVAGLKDYDTRAQTFCCPLHQAKITKPDVLEFWDAQDFNLQIEERQGNCTGCFLKDQGDIARVLMEEETDAAWWIALAREYPDFGGRNFPGYEQLLLEGPTRLRIEASLRAGETPEPDANLTPRRFKLVVRQEERRIKGEVAAFNCACERSYVLDEPDA